MVDVSKFSDWIKDSIRSNESKENEVSNKKEELSRRHNPLLGGLKQADFNSVKLDSRRGGDNCGKVRSSVIMATPGLGMPSSSTSDDKESSPGC